MQHWSLTATRTLRRKKWLFLAFFSAVQVQVQLASQQRDQKLNLFVVAAGVYSYSKTVVELYPDG